MMKAAADLSDYNLGELKGLLFEVDKEIKARQQREVKQARERILALAQGAGIAADQLIDGAPTLPRYRNPADPGQTWSGKGRQPKWVAQALAAGTSLDELRA